MTMTEIELRLTAVEKELARLKSTRRTSKRAHPVDTLDAIHGTFANDDAFKEAMRLGRKWRASENSKGRGKAKARSQ